MTKDEKIFIPIPAKDQGKYKAVIEAQEKFKEMAKYIERWRKNERPKWIAVKETRELIDKFLNQPANNITISYDDILNSFIKTGDTARTKINKNNAKVKSDDYGGFTYNRANELLDALDMYNNLFAKDKNKDKAKAKVNANKKVAEKNGWTTGTTERYLRYARSLPEQLNTLNTIKAKKLQKQ